MLRRPARGAEAKELRFCVVAYCLCLVAFQGLGVVMHLYSPDHAVLDAFWFVYIVSGCLSPCSYGAALTLDQVRGPWRRPAVAAGAGFSTRVSSTGLKREKHASREACASTRVEAGHHP